MSFSKHGQTIMPSTESDTKPSVDNEGRHLTLPIQKRTRETSSPGSIASREQKEKRKRRKTLTQSSAEGNAEDRNEHRREDVDMKDDSSDSSGDSQTWSQRPGHTRNTDSISDRPLTSSEDDTPAVETPGSLSTTGTQFHQTLDQYLSHLRFSTEELRDLRVSPGLEAMLEELRESGHLNDPTRHRDEEWRPNQG
ncbi:hypothetical protein C1H76_6895 [Elsinoe australis]|uniref:Uncharacterized protein n=1 Tax=Elsinoe australis TaxID=40998 RepID=A0A4U7ARI3_9PEZI|nr:hypothetical protein C1H76_6895 [Elsinoe australis]